MFLAFVLDALRPPMLGGLLLLLPLVVLSDRLLQQTSSFSFHKQIILKLSNYIVFVIVGLWYWS
jgi:hypothetical protein